jgi:hypothetical protein
MSQAGAGPCRRPAASFPGKEGPTAGHRYVRRGSTADRIPRSSARGGRAAPPRASARPRSRRAALGAPPSTTGGSAAAGVRGGATSQAGTGSPRRLQGSVERMRVRPLHRLIGRRDVHAHPRRSGHARRSSATMVRWLVHEETPLAGSIVRCRATRSGVLGAMRDPEAGEWGAPAECVSWIATRHPRAERRGKCSRGSAVPHCAEAIIG